MKTKIFVDTNVLIYARDEAEGEKRQRARDWLEALSLAEMAVLNRQVLNEFTRWMLRTNPRRPLEDVRTEIELLSIWGSAPIQPDEVELAWVARAQLRFQWFDCLLLAAAELAGCTYFLSEDMSDGTRFGSVTIIHPFRTTPRDLLFRD
jgi:predicted nucleic acid-binding protein